MVIQQRYLRVELSFWSVNLTVSAWTSVVNPLTIPVKLYFLKIMLNDFCGSELNWVFNIVLQLCFEKCMERLSFESVILSEGCCVRAQSELYVHALLPADKWSFNKSTLHERHPATLGDSVCNSVTPRNSLPSICYFGTPPWFQYSKVRYKRTQSWTKAKQARNS